MDTLAQADAFFAEKAELWPLFEALRRALCNMWPQTRLRVMKTCISFDDPKPYAYVSVAPGALAHGRPGLLLTFGLREGMQHPRFAQVVPVRANRYTVHLLLEKETQADDELMELLVLSRAQCARRK